MSTRISDFQFFTEGIDCTIEDLKEIPMLAKNGDFEKCRLILGDYARKEFKRVFELFDKKDCFKITESDEELKEAAEKAVNHEMCSVKIPYKFEGVVQWESNPTYNGYMEWPWQLNRHPELAALAKAYERFKDKRYLKACEELFESWFEQTQTPEVLTDENGEIDRESVQNTLSWRTIECGLRQSVSWPYILRGFYNDFDNDVLCDFIKSAYEHGLWLRKYYTGHNWLMMEMAGLFSIGVLYTFFKDSKSWYEFALKIMEGELERQIYPDGEQFELSSGYQCIAIAYPIKIMELAKARGVAVPDKMHEIVRKTILYYGYICAPDGKTPNINDGNSMDVKELIKKYYEPFEGDKDFLYYLTGEGKSPTEPSYIFEYSGKGILRSGFGKDDCYVLFDGGEFGTNHQHEDKLNVLFFIGQNRVLNEAGNYAYDKSDMRKYVLSSMSHNTVVVDGLGQNRKANYKWSGEITKKSDMEYILAEDVDSLRAEYNEGYGKECDMSAVHERSVYFVKNHKMPFVIVADRLYSEDVHKYEALWHLDVNDVSFEEKCVKTELMDVLVDKDSDVSVCDIYGDEKTCQGFICNTAIQMDYRPIHCITYSAKAKNLRLVTVLAPKGSEIEEIKASSDVSDRKIEIVCSDGETIIFEEKFIPKER